MDIQETKVIISNVDAVKSDQLGYVKGYLVRFGDAQNTDLENEFFTRQTDFGFPLDAVIPLNVYYHHGQDERIGRKSIGTGVIKADNVGLWYEAQLDMADEYAAMVAKLCREGKMGYSSGAASHLVERKSIDGGYEITRWPIAEASITPTPAEWRNTVKSIETLILESKPEHTCYEIKQLHDMYESLCEDIMSGKTHDEYCNMIDQFAIEAKKINIKHASLDEFKNGTIRLLERRLRDAVGLSRNNAKRLAPMVWDDLRDAGQITDENISLSTETKASDDTERSALMERLLMLELMELMR